MASSSAKDKCRLTRHTCREKRKAKIMIHPRNSVTVNTHDDNNPYGLRSAHIFTSSLIAVAFPLNQRKQAYDAYPRIKEVGTYILIDNENTVAYIGKSGELETRINSHASTGESKKPRRKKSEDEAEVSWSEAIVLTSNDTVLNESHIGYMEMCLIEIAKTNPFWRIENDNTPSNRYDHFDHFIKRNLEDLVNQAKKILPPIGCNLLRDVSQEVRKKKDEKTPQFYYNGKNFEAKMHIIDGNFVVLQGSKARATESPNVPKRLREGRKKLKRDGILEAEGNSFVFKKNCPFSSLSAAAQVVSGQLVGGHTSWKTVADGKTYKEWEANIV